ncbi:MAG: hypothetical protein HKN79_10875 [Flavobacteriales bacterium]|nr:hypothetical protein [Flavobacteriales bacterium]
MTEAEIQQLVDGGELPNGRRSEELISTHISWVLLTADRVYKIKKPVKMSFLDFSSLELRKYYCEEELRLNQRLTDGVYLDVLPIYNQEDTWSIGKGEGEIKDYAVEMIRLDNDREMDVLLEQGEVTADHISSIADILANFHKECEIIHGQVSARSIWEDFRDLSNHRAFIRSHFSAGNADLMDRSMEWAENYLKEHEELIERRDREGFTRDCHGDLHSGNIFLIDRPVLFDCIEFNPHFRQIDVLNELAFFAMDLDGYGREDLSEHLIATYQMHHHVIRSKEEEKLYLFYKLYRANVRSKVHVIKCEQEIKSEQEGVDITRVSGYWKSYLEYFEKLKADR